MNRWLLIILMVMTSLASDAQNNYIVARGGSVDVFFEFSIEDLFLSISISTNQNIGMVHGVLNHPYNTNEFEPITYPQDIVENIEFQADKETIEFNIILKPNIDLSSDTETFGTVLFEAKPVFSSLFDIPSITPPNEDLETIQNFPPKPEWNSLTVTDPEGNPIQLETHIRPVLQFTDNGFYSPQYVNDSSDVNIEMVFLSELNGVEIFPPIPFIGDCLASVRMNHKECFAWLGATLTGFNEIGKVSFPYTLLIVDVNGNRYEMERDSLRNEPLQSGIQIIELPLPVNISDWSLHD